jgi:hypothetical protein
VEIVAASGQGEIMTTGTAFGTRGATNLLLTIARHRLASGRNEVTPVPDAPTPDAPAPDVPPLDPTEPVPDDPGPLLPDSPEQLPPPPVEPSPDAPPAAP